MDNETQKIFSEQAVKLPKTVIDFLSSAPWNTDLDEIGSLYNLSVEELSSFKREVTLVLVGLVHPDAFMETLKQEVGIKGAVLEALVLNVEKKIFTPIRPALIKFFEEEAGAEGTKQNTENENMGEKESKTDSPTQEKILPSIEKEGAAFAPLNEQPSPGMIYPDPSSTRVWEKIPESAPDNLPTEQTSESFLPKLIPKTAVPAPESPVETSMSGESHPFEEKMKKVFTAGEQSMGELAIKQPVPQAPRSSDPYREPIE